MPSPLHNWEAELQSLSDYNQALQTPTGVNSGYWLPPIQNIVSPQRPEMVKLLFHRWLQICEVILTQLNGNPLQKSSKDWQCLLEVAGWRYSDPDILTITGQCHSQMHQLLNHLCKCSPKNDSENISLQPVSWNSAVLSTTENLPFDFGWEILWELQELGFRNDLVTLDRYLNDSHMMQAEWWSLLNACWKGTSTHVNSSWLVEVSGLRPFKTNYRIW
ncbi:hypothetical protein GYMLUDRAFT_183022 [Collybiopsis luxurians FD-317 M1]|uniref:Uncharacterized protein n=1 Tax=Collybiopsis luxurians FD-317 M1 TaxID=944289 RepID=A0A0D0C6A9_9AGAR|nr:hypothetical protein GYMLUDRAFT_183022 [Collybiopsis luxurians FD-317 M1]